MTSPDWRRQDLLTALVTRITRTQPERAQAEAQHQGEAESDDAIRKLRMRSIG